MKKKSNLPANRTATGAIIPLERVGDNLKNKFGVEFTGDDKKRLESLVNSANRKRNRLIKQEGELDRYIMGKPTGKKLKDYQRTGDNRMMGLESDFVIVKKSKSLQRFESREEFDNYIKNLERVTDRNYVKKRATTYKENYIKALQNEFGSSADDIAKKVNDMSLEDYMRYAAMDEQLEIGFIYEPNKKLALNKIRSSFKGIEEQIAKQPKQASKRKGRKK